MVSGEQVLETVGEVLVPGAMRSLARMNLIRDVAVFEGKIDVSLSSAALDEGAQAFLKDAIVSALERAEGVKEVSVAFSAATPAEVNKVEFVVAVMSGKGGVGKSLVAALLAVALARQGKEVGVLDADITGPSIPKMFGLSGAHALGSPGGILPVTSRMGIEVMSINLLLESEDDAVVWRGPMIAKAIQQFWNGVVWGKLDYLLVDLPPGTADAPLTVMQSLPVAGAVVVFSPQELAAMVVRKAVKMAGMMSIPILAVVENMSYFRIPGSDKTIELFGKSRAEEMARTAGTELMVKIPVDPELARLSDEGKIELYDSAEFNKFAEEFARSVPSLARRRP